MVEGQEIFRMINFSHRDRSCNHKRRYSGRSAAERAALDHRERVVCRGINVYWCSFHSCWHIGHPGNRRAAYLQLMADVSWFESWSRRN